MERGSAEGVYINTTGIGIYESGIGWGLEFDKGDSIIVSGTIGDHGIAVLAARGELGITVPINSGCASLNKMLAEVLHHTNGVREHA